MDDGSRQTASAPTQTVAPAPTTAFTPTPAPQARVTVSLLESFAEPAYDADFVYRFEEGDGLYVVGRDSDCTWLRVRAGVDELAWVNTQLERVSLLVACQEIPHATIRLDTGAVVLDRRPAPGYGELHVQNGLPSDACVLLAGPTDDPVYAVYVRTGGSAVLPGVPNADYTVYFSTGSEWDSVDGGFTAGAAYSRFAESIHYESSAVSAAVLRLTLHAVTGGAASVVDVAPEDFPDFGE